MMSKASLICLLALIGTVVAIDVSGGLEKEQPADEHVGKILKSVEGLIREKYHGHLKGIMPLSYRVQLVSGMNYFVRAVVTLSDGSNRRVHLRIYKPINEPSQLTALKTDVDESSPLQYFQ